MIKDQRVTLLHPARPQAPGGDISDVTPRIEAAWFHIHGVKLRPPLPLKD